MSDEISVTDARERRTVFLDGEQPVTLVYLRGDPAKAGPRRGRARNKAKVQLASGAFVSVSPGRLTTGRHDDAG